MTFWQRWTSKITGMPEPEVEVALPLDRLACRTARQDASSYKPAVLVSCGSFNPPTNLHMRMFEVAKDYLIEEGYDVLGGYMSPVNDAYNKAGLETAEHRIGMAKACAEGSDFVMVDAWEASQANYKRSLTVLARIQDHLRNNFEAAQQVDDPKSNQAEPVRAFLLCGSDVLESMTKPGVWLPEQLETLFKDHGVICIARNTADVEESFEKAALLQSHRGSIQLVKEPVTNNMSSTLVRDLVKQGKSAKYLVPDAVLAYIKQHDLYK